MEFDKYFFVFDNVNTSFSKELVTNNLPQSSILILSRFFRQSKKNIFYSHQLYNKDLKKIRNNTSKLFGFKFKVGVFENWEVVYPPNHHGVSLSVEIWDYFKNPKVLKFNNTKHDGKAFEEMIDYLKSLNKLKTHEAIEIIKQKERYIQSLEDKIQSILKTKSGG